MTVSFAPQPGIFPRLVPSQPTHQMPLETTLSAEIGVMPLAFGTAYNLLERAAVTAGSRILVVPGGQPAGYAVLRLATSRGACAHILCDECDDGLALAYGAVPVRDQTLPSVAPFDAVIDVACTPGWARYLRFIKPGGIYARTGGIAEAPAPGETRQIFLNDLTPFDRPHRSRELFVGLITTVAAPRLRAMPSSKPVGFHD